MVGKFEGPDFETEEDIISIWAATVPLTDFPEGYFIENYGGEDEAPFNPFSSDFGFGFYDHDFAETMAADSQAIVDFSELISRVSFSQSFFEPACAAAKAVGCEQTAYLFVLCNFNYDPRVTGTTESEFMRFVGAFPFDGNAGRVCDQVQKPLA